MRKLTTDEFINKAEIIHRNVYDYSKTIYLGSKIPIKILCDKHGEFIQRPNDHLNGSGCPKCGFDKTNQHNNLDSCDFINMANKKHNNTYDYSLVRYKDSKTKVKIICLKHGIFQQIPNNHLFGQRCPKCFPQKKRKTLNQFIDDANLIHNGEYDYSLVEYVNSKIKIEIICPKHDIFNQTPNSHLSGQGCPTCTESLGEKKIRRFLSENGIIYHQEKIFDDCKNIKHLRFDFYLPDKNMLIEFDGIQHFKQKKYFGGKIGFETLKLNDEIKNNYAKKNDIKIIRIYYWENVEKKLLNIL